MEEEDEKANAENYCKEHSKSASEKTFQSRVTKTSTVRWEIKRREKQAKRRSEERSDPRKMRRPKDLYGWPRLGWFSYENLKGDFG